MSESPSPPAETDRIAYTERDLDRQGIYTRRTRLRLRRAGKFPQPVRPPGGRLSFYRASDIQEWLENPEAWCRAQQQRSAAA